MDDNIANSQNNIAAMAADQEIAKLKKKLYKAMVDYKYTYNFNWMGRPIIQLPQDMVAMQEIIWEVKPDLIIETGIAHGGGLVFYASLLEAMGGDAFVLGVDIDIRAHNREAIEKHPMSKRIKMIQGSSIDKDVVDKVSQIARDKKRVLITLDSNHTHEHVLEELKAYSPLVTKDSYMVVFDTLIEDMDDTTFSDRPWGKGNSPKTAVWEFLKINDKFEIDHKLEARLLFTVAPDGYLRCIKD